MLNRLSEKESKQYSKQFTMGNRVRIKDIATKVGVSTALVSYVLNGKEKEKRVGNELVKKIREAATELNYQPNQIARSLRNGSTKTIGLIVADIAIPFFGQLARVIEDEAAKSGYTLILGSSDEDANKQNSLIDTLSHRQVDGLIIVPADGTCDQIADLVKRGMPIVLMDRYFPELNVSHVCLNNYQASYDAVRHLITKGFQRIGLIAYQSGMIHMRERIGGYREAMEAGDFSKYIKIIEVPYHFTRIQTEKAIEQFLDDNKEIDALLFATNSLTTAGLNFINKKGIKVPDQMGIVGYDGNEAFDFFYAPITIVEQPLTEIGTKSVNVLTDLINDPTKIIKYDLSHFLNIRNSSS